MPTLKHKEPKLWTTDVNPASLPQGEFTSGVAYAQRWRLPPPLRVGGEVAGGELVGAIGAATVTEAAEVSAPAVTEGQAPKDEEEMDDLELMAAILGKN